MMISFIRWLSVARLPYAILPYMIKFILYWVLRQAFWVFWNKKIMQIVRFVGDIINFLITSYLFYYFFENRLFLLLVCFAEYLRLISEKGATAIYWLWQIFPHQAIAKALKDKTQTRALRRYVHYHTCSNDVQVKYALFRLKAKAKLLSNKDTIEKLRYVSAFRIVPGIHSLRAGNVRDIATGEIFIYGEWLKSPELLYGLALRRSPWIFDPRYLCRPFYYRSEANLLMTRFVFENARLCPLFFIYQFGHEIKSARFEIFYLFFRWLGLELEEFVCEDGTYNFDVFAKFILQLDPNISRCQPLYSDEEILLLGEHLSSMSSLEIARKFSLPMIYVEEVLWEKIQNRLKSKNLH